MIAAVARRGADLARLCSRFGVRRLALFGSAAVAGCDADCGDLGSLGTKPVRRRGTQLGRAIARRVLISSALIPSGEGSKSSRWLHYTGYWDGFPCARRTGALG